MAHERSLPLEERGRSPSLPLMESLLPCILSSIPLGLPSTTRLISCFPPLFLLSSLSDSPCAFQHALPLWVVGWVGGWMGGCGYVCRKCYSDLGQPAPGSYNMEWRSRVVSLAACMEAEAAGRLRQFRPTFVAVVYCSIVTDPEVVSVRTNSTVSTLSLKANHCPPSGSAILLLEKMTHHMTSGTSARQLLFRQSAEPASLVCLGLLEHHTTVSGAMAPPSQKPPPPSKDGGRGSWSGASGLLSGSSREGGASVARVLAGRSPVDNFRLWPQAQRLLLLLGAAQGPGYLPGNGCCRAGATSCPMAL